MKTEDSTTVPRINVPYLSSCMDTTTSDSSGYYSAFSSSSQIAATTAEPTPNVLQSHVQALQFGYHQLTAQPTTRMPLLFGHNCPSGPDQYVIDPASPMQTIYSNTGSYHSNPEIELIIPPTHPPPNYSEAMSLMGQNPTYEGQLLQPLPPEYDTIMVRNEYPPNLTAALPNNSMI